MITLSFPVKYEKFVDQIVNDSEGAIAILSDHNNQAYMLHAEKFIIDLDACEKAKGRKLTENEEEFLLTRHIRQKNLHTFRLGNVVYLQKARGTSKCEVHLPMEMMDHIKKNAIFRRKTVSQLFAEMADYYLLTFGDATKDVHDYINRRHDDLHYRTGQRPETGIVADKRVMNSKDRPYLKSMQLT